MFLTPWAALAATALTWVTVAAGSGMWFSFPGHVLVVIGGALAVAGGYVRLGRRLWALVCGLIPVSYTHL